MRVSLKPLTVLATVLGLAVGPSTAHAGSKAARAAMEESSEESKDYNVVQNRFFLKADRFEIAPVLGYVPNNPFVKRYIGGLLGAYHFSETFAAEGAFMYAPDLGASDLKGLTNTLVQIAYEADSSSNFQQPLNKMILGATFAARWAPIYGKINLLGERVVNFDLYGVAGLGMLSIASYTASFNSSADGGGATELTSTGTKVKIPVNVGLGMNFFLNSSIAFKIDARSYIYSDLEPQYGDDIVTETRLYNDFVTSLGVGVYFPKMKPRIYNF